MQYIILFLKHILKSFETIFKKIRFFSQKKGWAYLKVI